MSPLTEARVDGLAAHLAARFGASIHRKADSEIMSAAGDLLGVANLLRSAGLDLGLPSSETWPRYGTTVGPFVFLPDGLDPLTRAGLLVHEVAHVVQARAEGWVRYAVRYLREPEHRAAQEAGAYAAEQELRHALTGAVPSLDQVVRIDHGYALSTVEVTFARLLTAQAVTAIAAGVYTQPVALAAMEYLRGAGVL